jgi:hypothetical protein
MPQGMAVSRSLVFVLQDGSILLDWGNNRAVDLSRGEFITYQESDYSHPIQDDELEILRRMGRISSYDSRLVYVTSVPDPPAMSE